MALRTNGSNQRLDISSGMLDHNANYTVCGWVYIVAADGQEPFFNVSSLNNGNAWQHFDWVGFTGTKLRLLSFRSAAGADQTGATTLSTGTWYHVALVRSGVTSLTAYLNGASEAALTNDVTGGDTAVYARMACSLDDTSTSAHLSARFWGWKAWTRALTAAELLTESKQAMPVSSLSLYGVWPFLAGATRAKDFSGKGHDWTEVNTPTDEDPPNVAFAAPEPLWFFPAAASGNTCTPDTASLTITTYAPTVTATAHNTAIPTTAALTLTTFAPTVTASDHQTVTPTTAALVLTTFAPTVTSGANNVCTPTTAALVLTTYAPTVTATANNVCTPDTAALVLTSYAPTVTAGGSYVEPTTAALVLTTYAPTVSTSSPVPIISYGEWDTAVTLIAGEEWMVTLAGPSCDAPKARVTVRFRWST